MPPARRSRWFCATPQRGERARLRGSKGRLGAAVSTRAQWMVLGCRGANEGARGDLLLAGHAIFQGSGIRVQGSSIVCRGLDQLNVRNGRPMLLPLRLFPVERAAPFGPLAFAATPSFPHQPAGASSRRSTASRRRTGCCASSLVAGGRGSPTTSAAACAQKRRLPICGRVPLVACSRLAGAAWPLVTCLGAGDARVAARTSPATDFAAGTNGRRELRGHSSCTSALCGPRALSVVARGVCNLRGS